MTEHPRQTEYSGTDLYDPYGTAQEPGSRGTSPFTLAARVLRGRWKWALGLASVLSLAGIVAAYSIPKVLYQSTGWIEVQPQMQRIIHKTEDNQIHPMFDAYVETQVTLASSRRIVDMAMDSAEWKELGRGRTDEEVLQFQKSLKVARLSRALFVQVSYEDEDPETARVAVKTVMDAYFKVVNDQDSTSGGVVVRMLENKRALYQNQLTDIRKTIQSVTEDKGPEDFRELCRLAGISLSKYNEMIEEMDIEIVNTEAAAAAPPRVKTEQEIALQDGGVATLLRQKTELQAKVDHLVNTLGRGAKEEEVVARRLEIATIQRQMDERVKAIQTREGEMPEIRAAKLVELRERRAKVVELRDRQDEEVARLGKRRGQLELNEAEQANVIELLDEVKRRLDEVNVESSNTGLRGRIRRASDADRPVAPSSDKRFQLATLGGVGGFALGIALVILWGLRDARMRHIADVDGRASHGRFLGILPDVQEGETPEASDAAAEMGDYCVHHIRTMVQLRTKDAKRVVTLTSPSPGSGKTTLALALAESFAAAGSRTLLIDCDLVGRGLTSAMRSLVCEDAGRVLVGSADGVDVPKIVRKHRMSELLTARNRSYSDAQIAELLESAREMAAGGDATFTRTVRTLESIARPGGTAVTGARPRRGILGAVDGAPIDDCVLEAAQENLYVLPTGDALAVDAVRLSHEGLQRLVAACRERFDTILIDTGPILGSIEAALATTVSGSTLLVVTRGERQTLVSDALSRLDQIEADVAGVIFNRASVDDVVRSKYVSRSASTPVGVA